MVLVVLVQAGDKYTVSLDCADFMPDKHAPILAVNDFDDPKVKATLEAVQKLRHADDEAKPNNEPTKH